MKCNVLDSLYFNCAATPYMDTRMSCIHNIMERRYWEIIDLELWFESDFNEGCKVVIDRVSRNGKYGFSKNSKNMRRRIY